MRVKKRLLAAIVPALVLGLTGPAGAVPPQHFSVTPPPNIVEDQGQACGFPVRWSIHLTVQGTNFFDQDGNLVRQQAHIKEENTISNLDAGLTLREGPDSFMQTAVFKPDGSVGTSPPAGSRPTSSGSSSRTWGG